MLTVKMRFKKVGNFDYPKFVDIKIFEINQDAKITKL